MGEYTKIDDLEVIRSMGQGLTEIKAAFDGLDKLKGQYEDDFGEHDLAWQFGDFAGNWDHHREELGEEVKRLGEIAKGAAKTYDEVDRELAKALRESDRKAADKKKGKS
ncbi:hypothetical protein HUT18_25605 [Streptomyces sp. NA04227]|uniref:hypothetical protein n=1 Tax=Streptomyces sp. NA04227 TaxID=2742136 RepID=UPI00159142D2|nr:hypothetical protein [Streptomyces sp. NA04227]QKW09255.1 hypothetical protein HUT18_25605 [Streptomyces sp. NA04227]